MPFVLDASVVLAWLLPDEKSEVAEGIIERVAEDRIFAPALLPLELEMRACKRNAEDVSLPRSVWNCSARSRAFP